MTRYEFAPLAALMGMSDHAAAVKLGYSGSTEQKYRREGMLEGTADRAAVKAGLHPSEVWASWFDDQAAAVSLVCESGDCDTVFIPTRSSHQRFCTPRCARRESMRRYRKREDVRLAELARKRAHYQECRDYYLAAQRRIDAARAPRKRKIAA